jgi:hypothetical protein
MGRPTNPFCSKCGSKKEFIGARLHCLECRKKWQANEKAKYFLKIYGISYGQYLDMYKSQGGLCAICGKAETSRNPSGRLISLSVDHDHSSGSVRGLLCRSCNMGLGHYKDSPTLLKEAAQYLEKAAA